MGSTIIRLLSFGILTAAIWHLQAGDCLAAGAVPHSDWQLIAEDRHKSVMLLYCGETAPPEQHKIIRLAQITRNEKQRLLQAKQFAVRSYSQHQEEYLLDCSVMTVALRKTMVFDKKQQLVKTIESSASQQVIIPETELDIAAGKVCQNSAPAAEEQENDSEQDSFEDASKGEKQLTQKEKIRIEMLKNQASKTPLDFKNWMLLGNTYYEAELPEEAIKAYERALNIKPESIEVLVDQGTMYRKAGRTEQALKAFDRALKLAPDNLEALYNKGYILAVLQNKSDEGLAVWKRYLELDNISETAKQLKEFMGQYSSLDHGQQTAVVNKER